MRSYTLVLTFFVLCVAYAIAKKSALETVSDGTIPFSVNFFKEVAKEHEENLICSSLSAHLVLSMAAYGAGGNTALQMRKKLGIPDDNSFGLQGFHDLVKELNNTDKLTLEVANKLYVAKKLKLKPKFKQLTSESFLSKIDPLDIDHPAVAASEVNKWVKDKTRQKIREIVKPNEITQDSRMILINAIYLNSNWARPFAKESTKNETFYYMENNVTKKKQVPTMYQKAYYLSGQRSDLNVKFIELPYKNLGFRMLIILPDGDEVNGLSRIVKNLEALKYDDLRKVMYEKEVRLYLPKFKIEKEIELIPILKNLGMTDMFTSAANFTGISNQKIVIDKVKQKAFIEVNEQGTEAAAVTYIGMMVGSSLGYKPPPPPPEFRVDRPFVFKILTNRNLELFSGIVVDPEKK